MAGVFHRPLPTSLLHVQETEQRLGNTGRDFLTVVRISQFWAFDGTAAEADLGEDGWDVAESYGVLENLDQAGDFVARVAEVESVRTAFIVTDDDSAFQMVCRDLPSAVLPVRLYESYLQNFMLRGGR